MSVVLVTGGTGTFGRSLVPLLEARGHEVRVLSRRPGGGVYVGDLATGVGVAEAAAGAELVVHAATDRRLGRSDPAYTRRLLAAAGGCRHLLYISIVGVDVVPFGYYRAKLACERLIDASPVPSTVLRATQFHELLGTGLQMLSRGPVAPLPLDWRFQSVAVADVAARAAETIDGDPLGRAADFGGPQILGVREIVGTWRQHHGGRPRRVLNLRWPGDLYRAFAGGLHTTPEHADGRQTWAEFAAATR
jgi:uncharacterized protein YbjT (DUF2867 family)